MCKRSRKTPGMHPLRLIPWEVNICQIIEVAQLRRQLSAQLVVAYGQKCQIGKVTQLRR